MSITSNQRQFLEVVFPGVAIGFGVGLLAAALAAMAGLPLGYAAATMFTLGTPLAIFGMGYSVLLAQGRIRLGGVGPTALYWLAFFPLARVLHEVGFDVLSGNSITLPDALLPFLGYQAILSVGYAIGFVWIHEFVFPHWWIRVRDHNPVAARFVAQYTAQAASMQKRKKANKGGEDQSPSGDVATTSRKS